MIPKERGGGLPRNIGRGQPLGVPGEGRYMDDDELGGISGGPLQNVGKADEPDIRRPSQPRPEIDKDEFRKVKTGPDGTKTSSPSFLGFVRRAFQREDPTTAAHKRADAYEAERTHRDVARADEARAREKVMSEAATADLNSAATGLRALLDAVGIRRLVSKGHVRQSGFPTVADISERVTDPMNLVDAAESGRVNNQVGVQLGVFLGPQVARAQLRSQAEQMGAHIDPQAALDRITSEQTLLGKLKPGETYDDFVSKSQFNRLLKGYDHRLAEREFPPAPPLSKAAREIRDFIARANTINRTSGAVDASVPVEQAKEGSQAAAYAGIADAALMFGAFSAIGEESYTRAARAELLTKVAAAAHLLGGSKSYAKLKQHLDDYASDDEHQPNLPNVTLKDLVDGVLDEFPGEIQDGYDNPTKDRQRAIYMRNLKTMNLALEDAPDGDRARRVGERVASFEGIRQDFVDRILVNPDGRTLRRPGEALRILERAAQGDPSADIEAEYARALLSKLKPESRVKVDSTHAQTLADVVAEALTPGSGATSLKDSKGVIRRQKGPVAEAGIRLSDFLDPKAQILLTTAAVTDGLDTLPNGAGMQPDVRSHVFGSRNSHTTILESALRGLQSKRDVDGKDKIIVAPSTMLAATVLSNKSMADISAQYGALNRLDESGISIMRGMLTNVAGEAVRRLEEDPQLFQVCAAMWVAGLEEALLAQEVGPQLMEVGPYTRAYAEATFDVLIAGMREMSLKETFDQRDQQTGTRFATSTLAFSMAEALAEILPPELASQLGVKILTDLPFDVANYLDSYTAISSDGTQSPEEKSFLRPVVLSPEVGAILNKLGPAIHNGGTTKDRVAYSNALGVTTASMLRNLANHPYVLAQQTLGQRSSRTLLASLAQLANSADPSVELPGDEFLLPITNFNRSALERLPIPVFVQTPEGLVRKINGNDGSTVIGRQELALTMARAVLTPSYEETGALRSATDQLQLQAKSAEDLAGYVDRADITIRSSHGAAQFNRQAQAANQGATEVGARLAQAVDMQATLRAWATELLGAAGFLPPNIISDHRGTMVTVGKLPHNDGIIMPSDEVEYHEYSAPLAYDGPPDNDDGAYDQFIETE